MKIDDIFLVYENSGAYFNSYETAYFNSKKAGCDKNVYYVFTPTMQRFKRVSEIEKCCRDYFRNVCDCDYYDIFTKTGYNQLKILEEI